MATAKGGYENPAFDPNDPSLDNHDGDGDGDGDDYEQDSNETGLFWPGSASTPAPLVTKSKCRQRNTKRANCQTHPTMKSLR